MHDESDLGKVIHESKKVVQSAIAQQNRRSHPFRNRYEHSLRVLTWAERIQQSEGGNISIITLAVLFHDSGWSDQVNHAEISAQIASDFLAGRISDKKLIEGVVSAVKTHNLRELPKEDLPLENRIVMDADLLDEVGVTTLVWDAMSLAVERGASYEKVYQKNNQFLEKAQTRMPEFKTVTGRNFYQDRVNFWIELLKQYAFELGIGGIK